MNLTTKHKLHVINFPGAVRATTSTNIAETVRPATPSPFFVAADEADAVPIDVEVEVDAW